MLSVPNAGLLAAAAELQRCTSRPMATNLGMQLDEVAFAAFAQDAEDALERALAENTRRHDLDRAARWSYNADDDHPIFRVWDAEEMLLFETPALEVGTYVPFQSTWKWGWCNPSLSEAHRRRMLALRELAAETGHPHFDSDQPFLIDEDVAWKVAAIAVAKLDGFGCYRTKITNKQGQPIFSYLIYVDEAER